jgi:hypothetical protein
MTSRDAWGPGLARVAEMDAPPLWPPYSPTGLGPGSLPPMAYLPMGGYAPMPFHHLNGAVHVCTRARVVVTWDTRRTLTLTWRCALPLCLQMAGPPPTTTATSAAAAAAAAAAMMHQPHAPALHTPPLGGAPLYGALASPPLPGGRHAAAPCLFVYNVPPETDEMYLFHLFSPYGSVVNVKVRCRAGFPGRASSCLTARHVAVQVMRDLATGLCKGFGFVNMSTLDEARAGIAALNGAFLGTKVLQVSFKQTRTYSNGSVASSSSAESLNQSGSSNAHSAA